MARLLALLLFLVVPQWIQSQVVINEFAYDDGGTDDKEFVEIYNPGPDPVMPLSLSIENRDGAGVSLMGVVNFPNVPIPPGGYYVLGNAAVPGVNQVIPVNAFENDEEALVLRSVPSGEILDTATYETNRQEATFPTNLIEGPGIWGNKTTNDGMPQSWSRYEDGVDTDNNGVDFGLLPWTPGTSNVAMPDILPYQENFDAFPAESPLPNWIGSFVQAYAVDPTISGPVGAGGAHNPTVIPASPQGGNCMTVMDPTGGGNLVSLLTPPSRELEFEAYVYIDGNAPPTGTEFESWSIGVRGTSDSFHNHPAPNPASGLANGNTGICWEFISGLTGNTLYLRDEGDGGSGEITLAQIPIIPGSNDGWQRLRLRVVANQVDANLGGVYGNPATGMQIHAETRFLGLGTVWVGYRENLLVNQNMRPVSLDALRVRHPTVIFQRPSETASATINQVRTTGFEPAVTRVCPGEAVEVDLRAYVPFSPIETAITIAPLVPLGGGGLISPSGQIINVDIFDPSLVWLNGITAPLFLPYPGPLLLPFPAPGVGFEASLQAVILDPGHPDGVVLSQGATLRVHDGTTAPCHPAPTDWPSLAPQVNAFACQFYSSAGLPLPLTWITDPILVSSFLSAVDTSMGPQPPIPLDTTQNAYLRTPGGVVFGVGLLNIAPGQPGTIELHEGTFPTLPALHTIIESAYGLTGYTSTGEKEKEKQVPAAEAVAWTEEELIPKPTKTGPFTGITLIIYQDDPGQNFLKTYADAKAAATGGEAFAANGLNSILNKLRTLYGQCKKVSCLIIACHGSPGSFRIGPKGAPFGGPSRVGRHPGQITPRAFGKAIRCYLAPGASIKLLSCSTARTDNATTGNGGQAIQDLADAAGVPVTATDMDNVWPKKPAPNPNCVRTPTTRGNVYTATPGAPPPAITTPAPAPASPPTNIDP